jgi:hypothetical protein
MVYSPGRVLPASQVAPCRSGPHRKDWASLLDQPVQGMPAAAAALWALDHEHVELADEVAESGAGSARQNQK